MLRYQTRRHRYLMQESEQALNDAAQGDDARDKRIAQHVLGDTKVLSLWESRHAELLVPVAEQRRRAPQIVNMRDIEVKLLHRRALIRTVRKLGIKGELRDRLFQTFYGPRDVNDAIIAEHKQYMLAASSHLSTDHLMQVLHDPVSEHLLNLYSDMYSRYFTSYCRAVLCADSSIEELYRQELAPMRRACLQMIKRLHRERPVDSDKSLEQQLLLARSGRYPVLNYMVG